VDTQPCARTAIKTRPWNWVFRSVDQSPRYAGHCWAYPSPRWWRYVSVQQLVEWKLAGESKCSKKTCPSATLSTAEVRRIIETKAEMFGNFWQVKKCKCNGTAGALAFLWPAESEFVNAVMVSCRLVRAKDAGREVKRWGTQWKCSVFLSDD
jgi:hypothetical protein